MPVSAFQLEAFRNGSPVENFYLDTPILITIDYLDQDVGQLMEDEIMLYVLDNTAEEWQRSHITLIQHDQGNNRLTVSYSDGDRAARAARSFALFGNAPEATATPDPNGAITPTATPTPPVTQMDYQQFLPIVTGP
ncbi:MAG: hypothetical protein R2867_17235 [Caldilineaceae bacterium]